MLTEKCRNQEAMIEEFELREQEYQEMMSETESVKQQNDSMKYVLYFTTNDQHSKKTNNVVFAPSKNSDKPGHQPSLISHPCVLSG